MLWNMIFLFGLFLAAVSDWNRKRIPDQMILLIVAAGIGRLITGTGRVTESMLGAILGGGILVLILLARPGTFGGGDVKLLMAGGFFLGWRGILMAFCLGVLLAGGECVIRILKRGKKALSEKLAFGPWLCLGLGMVFFCGDWIWQWFWNL